MEELLKQIGARICRRRKELGYTQEQLAEMIDVSIQMISNLERGNKAIRIENLLKLSTVLQVSTDYILTGKREQADEQILLKKIESLSERDYNIISQMLDYLGKN